MIDLGLGNKVIVTKKLDEAVQELDILFNTVNTELLGDTSYGTNFLQFLWECTPSPEELKKYIIDKLSLNTYYYSVFKYDINVDTYIDNNTESVYVVKIEITDTNSGDSAVKQYNIH